MMIEKHTPSLLPLRLKSLIPAVVAFAFILTAYGCGDRGPAERAGERIDDAVDQVQDLYEPAGPAERAGEKVDDAVDEVTD